MRSLDARQAHDMHGGANVADILTAALQCVRQLVQQQAAFQAARHVSVELGRGLASAADFLEEGLLGPPISTIGHLRDS